LRVAPIPDHAFFEQPKFQCLLGNDLLEIAGLTPKQLDLVAGGSTRRVARQPLLARFEELLRPVVVKALGNPLAPAKRGDRLLAAQTVKNDSDLLLRPILLACHPPDVLDHPISRPLRHSGLLSHLRSFERLR